MRAVGRRRSTPKAKLARALIVLATSTLVVCGVKGPPRPAEVEAADAGPADGGR